MAILYVGIDLAKNVFAVHGVDEHGKAVLLRASVPRARLHHLVAALPPCTIGMEACCVFQPIVDGRFRRSWTAFQRNVDAISG
jgi:hypothetical protein